MRHTPRHQDVSPLPRGRRAATPTMRTPTSSIDPRGTSRRAVGALASEDGGDDEEDRVYRPLLFNSKGYASSDLYRDTYEMRVRMSPSTALLKSAHGQSASSDYQYPFGHGHRAPAEPQIRLETLSSRAAMSVLWITYLSFVFAFLLPYIQSQGYLKTVVVLPGAECKAQASVLDKDEPCIFVDKEKNVARWSALVKNVTWYAGSIELRLEINEILDAASDLERADVALWRAAQWRRNASTTSDPAMAPLNATMALNVLDESFVLRYDLFLYGVDFDSQPYTKQWIVTEYNQSVWVSCPSSERCETAKLLEVTQDLGGSGYGSYLIIVVFKGMYPNAIGKRVVYDFAYTKPAIHVSELILRSSLLVATVLSLPCWFISVLNFNESWRDMLPVQKWVLALGIVLMLWQNPVYATVEWYRTISPRTRFVSDSCEAFAEAFFYVFWLKLMDYRGSYQKLLLKIAFGTVLFGLDTGMTILRMPKLFTGDQLSVEQNNELFVLLGFLRILLLCGWLVWIVQISWRTRKHLRRLPYMTTRFEQLSYRFLFLETLLVFMYVLVFSSLQVFRLLETWYHLGFESFVQASVHEFAMAHSDRPSLGKLIFLSVYVYLMMFVHLPPEAGNSTGLLATTAFHVEDQPRLDEYGFLAPDSHLFCVETAKWLLDLSWQAYFDPPGNPSPSGYGELKLEPFGYELVTQLRSAATDTYAIVAVSSAQNRLVIAFRGTTSKLNWKSNLQFHQEVLWITSKGKTRGRTCGEKLKDFAAKIPILNMALPSVHSGFWNAYASVRTELKEVIRLVLDENPGATVYTTGHSMGGTLAILAAYDLAVNMSMKVTMYNFGGPRVGNPTFVRHYNGCVPTSYRVVMDGDIVPGVPDFWGLYQHVGTEISIDQEGNLIVDPSFVEKKLHVSSKRKVASHPTHVYRAGMAKCLDNLRSVS